MPQPRTVPAPRPALIKAPDGGVHPASAHLSSLAVSIPKNNGKTKKDKDKSDSKEDRLVEFTVQMPKSVRRALRNRAEEFGWTAEEAAVHVLRVWSGA
jgi:hypothetical protein